MVVSRCVKVVLSSFGCPSDTDFSPEDSNISSPGGIALNTVVWVLLLFTPHGVL